MLLVDGYINSVDVVFNKIRNPSRGRTKVVASATRDARRKLPAERHDELLRRAVEISRTDGLGAVTLRKVAADLGVTPGLVSHYFSSAEQLITAAFRTAAAEDLEAARALLYLAACKVNANAPDKSRFSAMAKRLATDSGSKIVNDALQLFGGYGYLRDYPIERFWRDLRVHSILEGTNQVMRMIVGRDLLRQ